MIQYTPQEMVKIDQAVQEACNAKIRAKGETDYIKDTAERLKDELKLPTATFNSLVSERFDEKVSKNIEKLEEVSNFHDELVNARRRVSTTTTQPVGADSEESE